MERKREINGAGVNPKGLQAESRRSEGDVAAPDGRTGDPNGGKMAAFWGALWEQFGALGGIWGQIRDRFGVNGRN